MLVVCLTLNCTLVLTAVLTIHYLQSLNLQKKNNLQYLQYITYSNLLTIHVTVLTICYLQYITYNRLIEVVLVRNLRQKNRIHKYENFSGFRANEICLCYKQLNFALVKSVVHYDIFLSHLPNSLSFYVRPWPFI